MRFDFVVMSLDAFCTVFIIPTPLKIRAVPDFRGSPLRVPLSAPYTSGQVSCCKFSLKSSLSKDGKGAKGTQWAPP